MPKLPIDGSFSKEMNKEERNQSYYIVKSNQIVQQAHFSMPLSDQKVLAKLISSIKPHQHSLTVRFSTRQFMKMLGMRHSGTTAGSIMNTLYHILNDNFFIKRPDGSYDSWVWIDKIHADPRGKGDFLVRFRPELKNYLFDQSLKYKTIYKFSDIMLMKSRYSPRLYEIFRSNQSRQKVQKRGLNYSLDELHKSLNLMRRDKRTNKVKHDKNGNVKYKYAQYHDFNRRVLSPARHEINALTNFNVRIKRLHGRNNKTVGINVVMTEKNQKQKTRRDDLIYCIVHHIPKKEWKTWREDKISGKFHKINPRKHSKKNKRKKTVNGDFHVIAHKHKVRRDVQTSLFHKSPEPFSIIKRDKRSGRVKYFSPMVNDYRWDGVQLYNNLKEIYKAQKAQKKDDYY